MNWRCKKHDVDVAAGMYCVACADEMERDRSLASRHAQTFASDAGGDPLPDFKAMQAQLDRVEAMLAAILDYIYIRDGVAVG